MTKVLMISGDKKLLEPGTDAHARLMLQATQVEQLDVFVWPQVHSLREVFRAARATHYDVVTAQDPFWRGLLARRAARISGARLNVQVHTDFAEQSLVKKIIGRFVLRRAHSVRVVSQKIKQSLASLQAAPITVLPIFVDIEAVRAAAPAAVRTEHSEFKKIILVASRLEVEKNVAAAIKAMPEVLKEFPEAGLVIAGSGSERAMLEALAGNLGVANNVIFLGYRADVFSLYKEADVLFNPSLYEGYGASMVEALAAGVPVVSADVGVAKEAGATVVPRVEFARALVEVLRSGKRAQLQIKILSKEEWVGSWKQSLTATI